MSKNQELPKQLLSSKGKKNIPNRSSSCTYVLVSKDSRNSSGYKLKKNSLVYLSKKDCLDLLEIRQKVYALLAPRIVTKYLHKYWVHALDLNLLVIVCTTKSETSLGSFFLTFFALLLVVSQGQSFQQKEPWSSHEKGLVLRYLRQVKSLFKQLFPLLPIFLDILGLPFL